MSHARKMLRDYVATQLAVLGIPVYIGKVWLEDTTDLPAANILSPEDTMSEPWTRTVGPNAGPYLQGFTLAIEVEIRAIATANVLDVLDGYAADAQAALAADLLWGGLVKRVTLESVSTDLSRELETPYGVLAMTYAAQYDVDMRAPETPQ